jgi:hypothetical protein
VPRWPAWSAAGASAVALGIGAVYGLRYSDQNAEGERPDRIGRQVLLRDAAASQRAANVAYAVGGALAVGATLLWLQGSDDAAIAAVPTTRGVEIAYTARF